MVHCGVSGWKHPDWDGAVYPKPKPRGFHALEYLAQHVDVVEIDASFHRPIRPELARLWLHKTARNPNFAFIAHLGRQFTYERSLDPAAVREFLNGIRPLTQGGRLGGVLMRFPWSFRFTRENRDFIIELRRAFHEFPLIAELRHSSWTLDEALGTLMDYRIALCNVDQPAGARALVPSAFITSPIGYVRLLGRAGNDWTEEAGSADYLYSPLELGQWRARIERLAAHTSATYVVAANTTAGKAMINALQLRAAMKEPARAAAVPRRPAGTVIAFSPSQLQLRA